jgi:hypothetical protein
MKEQFEKMIKNFQASTVAEQHLWLIFSLLGGMGGAVIWLFLPHNSDIDSIWLMLFKISVFLLICLGIAFFPNHFRHRYLLVCLPFLSFLGYVLPRISYLGFFGGEILTDEMMTGELYTFLYLLLYPGIILTVCLAYRMGGGSPGNTLKIALNGVILIFSGFLDILWPLVNPVEIPAVLPAQHIKIVLGHFATYEEAVWFALFHIPVLIAVNLLPLDRWLRYLEPGNKRNP